MAGPRRSTRQAVQVSSQDASSPPPAKSNSGTKRKADDSSPPSTTKSKRGRPSKASKEQKTLEETMPETEDYKNNNGRDDDVEMQNGEGDAKGKTEEFERPAGCWFWLDNETYDTPDTNGADEEKVIQSGESFEGKNRDGEEKSDPEKALKDSRGGAGVNALDKVKADEEDDGKTHEQSRKGEKPDTNGQSNEESAIEEDKKREQAQPSNVMEKGIIYFFTRGRVGIKDPNSVPELQRSYLVLRPMPAGGKITDGVVHDNSNNRLIALPKKVWPKGGRDRFMAFVEKAGASMETLREEFFQGSEYSTKTTGTRQTPEVTPIGEGVYALTSSGEGRATNRLSYMLTIPQEIGEVQKDVGLAEKGSFVLSAKNPTTAQPSYVSLPQGPDFPKEIIDEFGGRGWLPAKPEHLNYANAQFLLIGESDFHAEGTEKDAKDDKKETAEEELEKLEHEDELRIEHLTGDDTVFEDLGISAKEYPSVKTTW